MRRQNIQQIIEEISRQNINLYPESYPVDENGALTEEGATALLELARGYWDNRNESEVERDEAANVDLEDYAVWVQAAFRQVMSDAE